MYLNRYVNEHMSKNKFCATHFKQLVSLPPENIRKPEVLKKTMKYVKRYYFRNRSALIFKRKTSSYTKTQETYTCLKSTIESLEKSEICSKSTVKVRTTTMTSFWCLYCYNFEHILHLFWRYRKRPVS